MNTVLKDFRPRDIAPFRPLPAIVTTKPVKNKIVTIPGLWSTGVEEQWKFMQMERETVCAALSGKITGIPGCLDGVSLMDYANDVYRLLKQTGPSILLGHSAGGYIAQIIATLYPELVKGLILVASSMPRAKGIKGARMQKRFFKARYIWAMITGNEYNLFPEDEKFVKGETGVELGPESGKVSRQILFRKYKVSPAQCSTLVVAARGDQFCEIYQHKDLAFFHSGNPGNLYVANGDHMLHCVPKHAEEVSRVVNSWLFKQML